MKTPTAKAPKVLETALGFLSGSTPNPRKGLSIYSSGQVEEFVQANKNTRTSASADGWFHSSFPAGVRRKRSLITTS